MNSYKNYAKIVTQNIIVNRIVLYGSYVRWDYRKSSDIDVAIIVPKVSISKTSSTEISKSKKQKGFKEAHNSVLKGGNIAKIAKEQLEKETRKKVIS